MGETYEQKADKIIAQGATLSNHVRQTVTISFRLGLRCDVLRDHRTVSEDLNYFENGIVLLRRLFDANIHSVPASTDINAALQDVADGISKK